MQSSDGRRVVFVAFALLLRREARRQEKRSQGWREDGSPEVCNCDGDASRRARTRQDFNCVQVAGARVQVPMHPTCHLTLLASTNHEPRI